MGIKGYGSFDAGVCLGAAVITYLGQVDLGTLIFSMSIYLIIAFVVNNVRSW